MPYLRALVGELSPAAVVETWDANGVRFGSTRGFDAE